MKEVKGKVCGKTASKIAEERKAAFSRKMEKDIERFIAFILDEFDKKDITDSMCITIYVEDNDYYYYYFILEGEKTIEELEDIVLHNNGYINTFLTRIEDYFKSCGYYAKVISNFIEINIRYEY